MAWTNISDTFLEPGKPVRSADLIALRDNPIAVAAGAAGAPGVASAALIDYPWGNEDIRNSTLGAEKFQSGAAEINWVLARNAGASAGAVGSYAMGRSASSSAFGGTLSGGTIDVSNASASNTGPILSGTWRCMGNLTGVTIFLRIS